MKTTFALCLSAWGDPRLRPQGLQTARRPATFFFKKQQARF